MMTSGYDSKPDAMWTRALRDALSHLYDAAHLQGHVLQDLLEVPADREGGTARGLQRVLLETMELLRPPAHVPHTAREWRAYQVLYDRYVQRVPPLEVARGLAISERQFQREHARALEAMAALLEEGTWRGVGREDCSPRGGDDARAQGPCAAPMGDVERLVAGSRREVLDANELLRGVVDAVEGLAASRGVTIWLEARVPAKVHGDRAVLRQALLGVATCLVARMDGGSLTVRMAGGDEGESRGKVNVDFWAHPVPAGLVLDPDATGSERLHLAGRLVRAAAGEVWSQDGALRVALPSGARVLMVVDDNPDVIGLLRRYLAGQGYRVVGVTRPDRALAEAQEVRPFLVLLDVMMPSHDGWEILQALKHHPDTRAIPVAVCSVLDEPELATSLGADDYCRKPLSREGLLELVGRWIERGGD
jgi:CheY-like chemotaxis protein